jgi:c(7)-type cytochrome triheme protein
MKEAGMRRSMIPSALLVGSPVLLSVVLAASTAHAQGANAFNRLHTAPSARNAPPASDGLHDPTVNGTQLLQSPKEAFEGLPKASGGNYVNWGDALKSGKIAPRFDKDDDKAKPELMDLDIIREVKGTTPNAVFPHAAHAEWMDCPVCHPAIFEAAKGANTMTMAEIMVGQKCGVCHGTVAFPIAECKRCHYQQKAGGERKVSVTQGAQAKKTKKGLRMPWQD